MATVRENLIAAKALIDAPDKWAKCAISDDGTMCALRAIEAVCGLTYSEGYYVPEGQALQRALDDMNGPENGVAVGPYNDARSTTHDDIMALFDRAIEASE